MSGSMFSTGGLSSPSDDADGTIDLGHYDGGCFHSTNKHTNPWFSVEIDSFYNVQYVIINKFEISGEFFFICVIATL
jgi:hypothetical protein